MARTSELEAAYRATTYRVFLPEGACDLRVGVVSVPLRCWLKAAGIRRFAILTAFNPHSCLLPAADNALRQARLHRELLVQGYSFEVGENLAADDCWPAEATCLVADIPVAAALAFAGRYGQNAIVYGTAAGAPRLCWRGAPA